MQSIAGKGPELKGGLNKEFRQDFYEALSEEPYKLELEELNKLEKAGGEGLTELAKELSKLDNNQIKDLKEEVKKLKKKSKKRSTQKIR
ncbi:MAG: hypothetical protein PG981_000602 [Wolbachia endosymbiont of Ctenocephalides orientis wCori]|nr:MAG: hypothetical protein PG981_000602 [Wolbachia endosymbiont of Ctenocephalides orientis wCori]